MWIIVWVAGKLCDPSLTRAILSDLEVSSHKKALYKMSCLQLHLRLSTSWSVITNTFALFYKQHLDTSSVL